MIKVSAPAKVHLIGEHSVVYEQPAIITAVGRRAYIEADRNDDVVISSKQLGGEVSYSVRDVVNFASKLSSLHKECSQTGDFTDLKKIMKEDPYNTLKVSVGKSLEMLEIRSGIYVSVDSDIPIGAGVGSSSSIAVAVPKAIAEVYEKALELEKNNRIAFEIEQFNHGKPSGGDNATCCYGGLVWFVKGTPPTIQSLKEEIPYSLENFALLYTSEPELTTLELVQAVANKQDQFKKPRIDGLGKATYEMRNALKEKDLEKVRELMNYAHTTLAELGVSTPELDKIHKAVNGIGGAAKLCGAGGGGIMLLQHDDLDSLENLIRKLGYGDRFWPADLSVEGVRIEN